MFPAVLITEVAAGYLVGHHLNLFTSHVHHEHVVTFMNLARFINSPLPLKKGNYTNFKFASLPSIQKSCRLKVLRFQVHPPVHVKNLMRFFFPLNNAKRCMIITQLWAACRD